VEVSRSPIRSALAPWALEFLLLPSPSALASPAIEAQTKQGPVAEERRTTLGFDGLGRVVEVIDAEGKRTTYDFQDQGTTYTLTTRLEEEAAEGEGEGEGWAAELDTTYDANGNLESVSAVPSPGGSGVVHGLN